jgi:hypothetical protein
VEPRTGALLWSGPGQPGLICPGPLLLRHGRVQRSCWAGLQRLSGAPISGGGEGGLGRFDVTVRYNGDLTFWLAYVTGEKHQCIKFEITMLFFTSCQRERD